MTSPILLIMPATITTVIIRPSLVIPQKYRDQAAAGAIEPKFWDDGAPAARTSYQFSGSQQHYRSGETSSAWLGLESGINLGAWRLRNNSTGVTTPVGMQSPVRCNVISKPCKASLR